MSTFETDVPARSAGATPFGTTIQSGRRNELFAGYPLVVGLMLVAAPLSRAD